MQPLKIKLYDIARAKMHLKETDAMEFVSTIQDMQENQTENWVTKDFLSKELSETKSDIIKWMFLFWIGQMSVALGIVLLLIQK